MRYFWTLFWTFLLVQMASYVIGSMQAATYSFSTASVVAVIVTALIIILGAVIPNEPVEDAHH
ncbi:YjzD family protein [Ferdinandcohnia sp. Marseille-Q9671]